MFSKTSLANFRVYFLKYTSVSIPAEVSHRLNSNFSTFIILHSSSKQQMHYMSMTVGRWLVVNHKLHDYASTALIFVSDITTMLYGSEIKAFEKEYMLLLLTFTKDVFFMQRKKNTILFILNQARREE